MLADYSKIHFAVEENPMRFLGYPYYEQHKAQHEDPIRNRHYGQCFRDAGVRARLQKKSWAERPWDNVQI